MLRAFIFDLGGTLLHYGSAEADLLELTRRGLAALYRHLIAKSERVLTQTDFLTAVTPHVMAEWQAASAALRGSTVETPLKAALDELGFSLGDNQWRAARQEFFAPIQSAVEPRKQARQTLQTLQERGMALGLLSNTFWAADMHDADLARFGLLDLLPTRLYSCDIGWLKPHPESFRMALAAIGMQPNEAVYVGDRLKTDVQPAREAGLWGVLIKTPFRDEQLRGVMPDAIINELPELIGLLEQRR
jgi:putative hydrolase of the HAD superfamily